MVTSPDGIGQPLTADQRDLFRQGLRAVKPHDETVCRIVMETGMARTEVAHFRENWLQRDDSGLRILVPPGDRDCSAGGDPPCSHCQQKRDGIWSTVREGRAVPVFEEQTAQMVESALRYKDTLTTISGVEDAIVRVAEEGGIERKIRVKTIQNTFVVKMLESGFSLSDICQVMGYHPPESRNHPEVSDTLCNMRRLGDFCEGQNPFVCGVEVGPDNRCTQPLLLRDDPCQHHDQEWARCRSIRVDGDPCRKRVATASDKCDVHSGKGKFCNHVLEDGSECKIRPLEGLEYCLHHADAEQPICGHPVDDGVCQRLVSDEEKCAYHRGSHDFERCGASLSGGGACNVKVSDSDEHCPYHREQGFDKSICGHPIDDGQCERLVSNSGEKCHLHQDHFICGAKTGTEERCQHYVEHSGDQCYRHQD